ncbi:DUF308 domain-containing protein [Phytohabitans aurantiacus]|uniref:DUF4190 domain-containing protein n=1 Tax=Phytohabitans aurantiacus TaxID=3016789 RepID=A0ABQ5QTA7_9ACTN|nr:DUF308 domain-containing protein [Phytohabitans aurantiacus]GLH97237.1 hypothetical protein Pa4123_25120 [Phytohabitans aurantiacus]
MVRMPSFSRHSTATDSTTTDQERVDERRTADTTAMNVRTQEDERAARERAAAVDRRAEADRAAADRAETERISRRREPGLAPEPVTEPEVRGPRPRASLMATLALISGVAGALFVLTGVLAGYGIVLAALAVLFAVGGFSATSRRHVAGKSDAMIGLLLGIGAIVVGILVLTDSLSWLTTASDKVGDLRTWLDNQTVDRF